MTGASGERDQNRAGPLSSSGSWPELAGVMACSIMEAAHEIESCGAIPDRILEQLHAVGAFRLMLPHSLGGAELDLVTFASSIERLAAADASTAWCVGQAAGCCFSAAYLDPRVAREIFAPPDAVVAWGPATHHSRATAVEGGYLVTGSWSYASGIRHATWLGAHVAIFEPDGSRRRSEAGKQVERTMLFPRRAAKVENVWQVMGLRGTGSDDYSLEEHFIPERFTYERDSTRERRESGPLYKMGILGVYGIAFSAVALGVARATLDAFVVFAADKIPKASAKTLRDSAATQLQVGCSEAKLRAARAYLFEVVEELWDTLASGAAPSTAQRLNLRMAVTHAIQEARLVVETAYMAAGASAIFERNPFERRFRDIHVVSQQIQGHLSNLETAGQVLLGVAGANPRI